MKRKLFPILFVCALTCGVPLGSKAQANLPDAPNDVPIDGGLSILLATGVAYVVKKGHDKRKKSIKANNEDRK